MLRHEVHAISDTKELAIIMIKENNIRNIHIAELKFQSSNYKTHEHTSITSVILSIDGW